MNRAPINLPAPEELAAARRRAEDEQDTNPERYARILCTVIAAAVHAIHTDNDPDARVETIALELTPGRHGTSPTGTYWTTDGQAHHITDPFTIEEIHEWTTELTPENSEGWHPLCSPTDAGTLRLDLERAARLP